MNQPTPESDSPANDALAAHGAFLRRLARSLVRDEQRAEDIVQEAYIAVLKRPPPPRVGLRAWMSGIVKNLARRSARTDSRRRKREEHAPPVPTQDAPDEITVRLELQQRLAEAVRVLPEPARTTVVRRYYDGLTPTQVAEAEGIPVRTVESRLRRAREQLRGVLDRASGGERGPWMLAFAPMAFDPEVLAGLFAGAEAAAATAVSGAAAGAPAAAASAALAVALVGGVSVGGFLWGRADAPAPRAAAEVAGIEDTIRARQAEANLRILEGELVVIQGRRQRLEALLASLRGEKTTAPAVEHGSAADEARWETYKREVAKLRYEAPAPDPRLAETDWAEGGRALARLNAGLAALTSAKGQRASLEALSEVQRWNGALVALETSLREAGELDLETLAANSAFTRPYVQANLIRAALLYAELPLSDAKSEALDRIARRHVELDRLREQGFEAGTIALRRLIALTEQRRAFFDEVGTLLTQAQRDVLQPPSLRGRVGFDLFSDGSMWQRVMEPLEYHETTRLEEHAVRMLVLRLEIRELEQRAIVVDEVRRWIAGYPADHLGTGQDKFDEEQLYALPRVRAAAAESAKLYERLIERLPRGTPAHEMLMGTSKSLLPIRRPR